MNTFLGPVARWTWSTMAVAWLFAALPVIAQNVPGDSTAAGATEDRGLEDFIERYLADHRSVSRFYDLPWSEARFDRLERLYRDWQSRLGAVPFDELKQQGRIDYLLLRTHFEAGLNELTLNRRRLAAMDELLAWRKPIQELEQSRWRMEAIEAAAGAGVVAALPETIKKLRERLEKGKKEHSAEKPDAKPESQADQPAPLKLSPALALRAASAVDDVRGTLESWYSFYAGYQPDFSWWLTQPYEAAHEALKEYAKFLREEMAGVKGKDDDPLIGEPVGAAALAQDLATEMIPYSAEELIAIGERELAWCEAEMKRAAQAMGCGDDWHAALAKVKAAHAQPGQQDRLVTACGREAIQFVKEHDLVTVPPLCEETWRVSMISPEAQKTTPYAAYGGQNVMVAYAKDEMKHEDKLMAMRGNNRHFTRIVVAHELIPGHHLYAFVTARHRPYRSIFRTPFLTEGWALYWEIMLWERGYGQTPEDRIGMLFWRMHRCARIIVSLKFHLGALKPAEMVEFLVDRVGHERAGATSEVRRFIGEDFSPLYQCAYMIGGLQLRALRQEQVGAGRMTDRQFNDLVLTYGGIPAELIRAGMLNLPLTRETGAAWRFAGDKPGGE